MFTAILNHLARSESPAPEIDRRESIRVRLAGDDLDRTLSFTEPFCVGHGDDRDVRVETDRSCAGLAEVYRLGDLWWVRDLGSDDGIYLDEELIEAAPINGNAALRLGEDGPKVWLRTV